MSSPATMGLRAKTKALRLLSDSVKNFLAALDVEMKKPSSLERGSRIATASNALELQNDIIRRHNLNLPLGR